MACSPKLNASYTTLRIQCSFSVRSKSSSLRLNMYFLLKKKKIKQK